MSEDALRRSSMAAKATALLGMLDRNCAFAGLPPLAGKSGVEAVRAMAKKTWRALARDAGVNPPSAATIELVVEGIEARRGPVRAVRQLELPTERKVAS